jgi:hypothetical protein
MRSKGPRHLVSLLVLDDEVCFSCIADDLVLHARR